MPKPRLGKSGRRKGKKKKREEITKGTTWLKCLEVLKQNNFPPECVVKAIELASNSADLGNWSVTFVTREAGKYIRSYSSVATSQYVSFAIALAKIKRDKGDRNIEALVQEIVKFIAQSDPSPNS
jgi:hypothetical protein